MPASAKAVFLILELLIFFYLDFSKSPLLGMTSQKTHFIKRYYSPGQKPLPQEIKQIAGPATPQETTISNVGIMKLG